MSAEKKTYNCDKVGRSCKYNKRVSSRLEESYCDYICMVGHRRGCSPKACDKYERNSKETN